MVPVRIFNFLIKFFYLIVFCFLVSNTNRHFGGMGGVPQSYLSVLGWLFGIVNGSTRFIWGMLMDKFGFKFLMIIISIIEMGVSGSIYFLVDYGDYGKVIYLIENLLIAICLSGTFTMITPLFNKVFGKDYGAEMYGLTGFSIGLASFCGPLLIKAIVPGQTDEDPKNEDKAKKDEHYFYLYVIGGAICFIKFIVVLFFKEDEQYVFNYKKVKLEIPEDIEDNNRITRPTDY